MDAPSDLVVMMKPHFPGGAFFSRRSRRSGSALLIILGCVALLTILVVAFLVTARTEFTTSNFYAKGVNTKLLAENVINLVMAQLREGARSTDVNTGATVAWASQPGMIRSYDSSGNPYKYFKLYSWDNMVGTGLFDETLPAEVPPTGSTGWSSQPNVFTDLNEPVNGTYPIIDPAAQNNVEGFSFTAQTDTSNTLSMPVKWLYVLKDGSVTVGAPTGSGTAVHINNASVTNPVVGRVAFWTDDETSKVNINTASEGIFWDQPYGNSTNEMGIHDKNSIPPFGFAETIPSANEFARVPGHPAQTSLSAVFGFGTSPVLPDTSFDPTDPDALTWPLTTTSYTDSFAPYYSLTPRYQAGATMGGSQYAPQNFVLPGYRLYDSVDELAMDPSRLPVSAANSGLYLGANGADPAGRSSLPALTPQVVEQRRFFLTAHSRAPEETLFGTPRISLWPLQDGTQAVSARTAKDNLLAFCSTLNGQPYYFQRTGFYQYQAVSGGDVLNSPTAIPSTLSATEDMPGAPTTTPQVGVARNENLYAYLQALTGGSTGGLNNIPGFGGNFYAKYPGGSDYSGFPTSDRDEILTQMFDLLRSGVNTFSTSPNILPHYTYTPYKANAVDNPWGGPPDPSEVVPISISSNHTHGLGRTYNFGQISLVFMAQNMDLNLGTPANGSTPAIPPVAVGMPDRDPGSSPSYYRMSIGTGLPWAVPIDNAAFFSPPNYSVAPPTSTTTPPRFLYWDSANSSRYGAYIYQTSTPSGTPMLQIIDPTTNLPAVDKNGKQVPLPATAVTIADPQTTFIQAFLLLQPQTVVQGIPAVAPSIRVRVSNLDELAITFPGSALGHNLGFPPGSSAVVWYNNSNSATTDSLGGMLTPFTPNGFTQPPDTWSNGLSGFVTAANGTPYTANAFYNDGTNSSNNTYPLIGIPVQIPTPSPGPAYPSPYGGEDTSELNQQMTPTTPPLPANPPAPLPIHNFIVNNNNNLIVQNNTNTMTLNSATLKIDVYDGISDLTSTDTKPLQTFYVKIPGMELPIPTIEMANQEGEGCGGAGYNPTGASNNIVGPRIPGYIYTNPPSILSTGFNLPPNMVLNNVPAGTPPGTPFPIFGTYYIPGYPGLLYNNTLFAASSGTPNPQPGVFQALNYYWQLPWDVRSISQRLSNWWSQNYGRITSFQTSDRLICRGDIVRSFVLNPTPGSVDGDLRLLAANPIRTEPSGNLPNLTTDDYIPMGDGRSGYSDYPTTGPYTSLYVRQLHSLTADGGNRSPLNLFMTSQPILSSFPQAYPGNTSATVGPIGYIGPQSGGIGETSGQLIPNEEYAYSSAPNVTPELQGAFMDAASQIPGGLDPGSGTHS